MVAGFSEVFHPRLAALCDMRPRGLGRHAAQNRAIRRMTTPSGATHGVQAKLEPAVNPVVHPTGPPGHKSARSGFAGCTGLGNN
jgi:hypothetical protein